MYVCFLFLEMLFYSEKALEKRWRFDGPELAVLLKGAVCRCVCPDPLELCIAKCLEDAVFYILVAAYDIYFFPAADLLQHLVYPYDLLRDGFRLACAAARIYNQVLRLDNGERAELRHVPVGEVLADHPVALYAIED